MLKTVILIGGPSKGMWSCDFEQISYKLENDVASDQVSRMYHIIARYPSYNQDSMLFNIILDMT